MPVDMLVYGEDRVSHCSFHLITTMTEYTNEETGLFVSCTFKKQTLTDMVGCQTRKWKEDVFLNVISI